MKENIIIGLLIFIAVMVGFPFMQEETTEVLSSSTCNNGNCTDFDAVDVTAGYYVDGVSVINGSGQISTSNAATVGAFTQGGGVFATSTSASAGVIPFTYFDTENRIDITLNSVDSTQTFDASSTMATMIPSAGDTRTIYIRNATTTAAMDLTIAAGTGMQFKNSASSSASLIGDTDGLNTFEVTFQRIATGGNILIMLTRFQND